MGRAGQANHDLVPVSAVRVRFTTHTVVNHEFVRSDADEMLIHPTRNRGAQASLTSADGRRR
jgi:hypothetical protein